MLDANAHVAGENAVWVVMSLLAAWIYWPHFRREALTGDIFRGSRPSSEILPWLLAGGIVLAATGGAIHRLFWMVWRWLGRPEWMTDISAFFTTPAVLLIFVGYSLHAYPLARKWCGRWWWAGLIGYAATAYATLGVAGRHLTG